MSFPINPIALDAFSPELEGDFESAFKRTLYPDDPSTWRKRRQAMEAPRDDKMPEPGPFFDPVSLDRAAQVPDQAFRDRADALAMAIMNASQVNREIERQETAQRIIQAVRSNNPAAVGQETERKAEALRLGSKLADLVSHSADGKVTPEMKSLAAGVRSALGSGTTAESLPGRAFAKDLVPGGLYIAKGWSSGEFDWTFIGVVPGDADRITIRRGDKNPTVELLGDHGLAPYDASAQGKFWHPSNWTEGTGVGAGTGRAIADAAAAASGSLEIPQEDEDVFP